MIKVDKKSAIKIFERELNFIRDSLKNSENPFHFFYFTTINNKKPENRTVVLRDLKLDPIRLFFNTDFRSNKVNELKKNQLCSALFYDNKRRIQLRLNCEANIHKNNKLAKTTWDKTPLQSRKCYMAPYAPGVHLKQWEPNLPKKYIDCDPEKKDSELGYKNFSVIELLIKSFEIIELHYDGHIRFKLENDFKEVDFLSS